MTLDDSATNPVGVNRFPETGVFRPAEPLSAFVGEDPNGTWALDVTDSVGSDPLCYYGAILVISTDTAVSSTSVTASPNPGLTDGQVAFTATVIGDGPIGDVEFFLDGNPVGSAPVINGQASLPGVTLAAGSYQVTAFYPGDVDNTPSTTATSRHRGRRTARTAGRVFSHAPRTTHLIRRDHRKRRTPGLGAGLLLLLAHQTGLEAVSVTESSTPAEADTPGNLVRIGGNSWMPLPPQDTTG